MSRYDGHQFTCQDGRAPTAFAMKKPPVAPLKVQPSRDENTVEMFPELLALVPPPKPAPLTPAERQKRRRDRVRELKAAEGLRTVLLSEDERRLVEQLREQKAVQAPEDVQAIALTQTDRMVLSLGLLAHEDLHHRPKDWETSKKPGFDALLRKLWPEGDNGRYLAEPERSTRRPAAFLRDQLDAARVENQRLKSALQEIAAEVSSAAVAPMPVLAPAVASFDVTQLNGEEINLIKAAVHDYGQAWQGVPWKVAACESLWRRLTIVQTGREFHGGDFWSRTEGDTNWSQAAVAAETAQVRAGLAEGRAAESVLDLAPIERVVTRAALDYYAESYGEDCPPWRDEVCLDLWRRLGGLSVASCPTWPPREQRNVHADRAHYVTERAQLVKALEYANTMNAQMVKRLNVNEKAAGVTELGTD
ncbi:hypothetical protein [Pseudomonas fluorescens group sp. PF-69]